MKCQHLVKLPYNPTIMDTAAFLIGKAPHDITVCIASNGQCQKKCQPCEINARCWSLG